jgi:uncharacterized protein YkwD
MRTIANVMTLSCLLGLGVLPTFGPELGSVSPAGIAPVQAAPQFASQAGVSLALPQPRTMAATSETLEQSVLRQINQYRADRKLPPLQLDARINAQALAHSQAMASRQVPFSHNGFDQRVKTIGQSIAYRSAAENVAYNMGYQDPATQAVQGWLKSPGHLKNIQGQFNLTGIAVARNSKGEYYFTQIFIRSR